ncbi:MAG: DUF1292 domain-containing protein [Lachnospiraceae bacterium]|nr:DUF1292 domain-containing protein [Lachnospiraceae bacterium]MBQ6353986.1 DUF1292 domain-containing protein [Lachnospiraceae bacterium]
MKQGEQMVFTNDLGEEEVFYVQAVTVLGGVNYILVTETEDLAGDAYIMKQSEENEEEITFDMVDDEDELDALADVFEELIAEEEEEEDE